MSIMTDLLGKRIEDVKRPSLLPAGTYAFVVQDTPVQGTTKSGLYEFIRFPCRPLEALDDVDAEELDAYGPLSSTIIGKSFFLTDDPERKQQTERTMFELKTFLEALGVIEEGMTIGQALSQAKGAEFAATVSWMQNKNDPEQYFVEIGQAVAK